MGKKNYEKPTAKMVELLHHIDSLYQAGQAGISASLKDDGSWGEINWDE